METIAAHPLAKAGRCRELDGRAHPAQELHQDQLVPRHAQSLHGFIRVFRSLPEPSGASLSSALIESVPCRPARGPCRTGYRTLPEPSATRLRSRDRDVCCEQRSGSTTRPSGLSDIRPARGVPGRLRSGPRANVRVTRGVRHGAFCGFHRSRARCGHAHPTCRHPRSG